MSNDLKVISQLLKDEILRLERETNKTDNPLTKGTNQRICLSLGNIMMGIDSYLIENQTTSQGKCQS